MKRNKLPPSDRRVRRSVFSTNDILLLLVLVASCVSFYLLIRALPTDFNAAMSVLEIRVTWLSAIFISAVNILVFSLHKKLTLEAPTRRILDATSRIGKGDFSVRIRPFHKKHFKNEFDVIIEDLNKMAEELSGVETMKTDFIANVSHELKTPLAVIGNYTTLLQAPDLSDEKRAEYIHVIADAVRRLNTLITNILKLNKLESQQIFPETADFDLGEQLCEALLNFEHVLEEKDLELETALEEDVIVHADADLLMHVWDNLISNAVKFTPTGGAITVTMQKKGAVAEVTVADTGCGMTKEEQQHVFERFYQGDSSRSVQGNGLGLALVKRIADITGSRIFLTAEPGKGSAFTVRMPLDQRKTAVVTDA